MKKIILPIILSLLLSSCGTVNDVIDPPAPDVPTEIMTDASEQTPTDEPTETEPVSETEEEPLPEETEKTDETEPDSLPDEQPSGEPDEQPVEELPGEATVTAAFASDADFDREACRTYSADDTDSSVEILLTASGEVKDFRLLALTFTDVDENGKVCFDKEELVHYDTVTPDSPLLVTLTIFGTIPGYGISYTAGENVYSFAIEESGMDGSLLLTPID